MLVWILRKQTDEPEKVVSYGVLPVLLGTSLCVVIRGFSAKLSVLEKIPDYQSQGHISAKGCRASLLLASICPLQEGNDAPCIVFLHGNNSNAQCGFQRKKGFGAKSELYPGCCARTRLCLGPCANSKQMYCVLFDIQMKSHGGM